MDSGLRRYDSEEVRKYGRSKLAPNPVNVGWVGLQEIEKLELLKYLQF